MGLLYFLYASPLTVDAGCTVAVRCALVQCAIFINFSWKSFTQQIFAQEHSCSAAARPWTFAQSCSFWGALCAFGLDTFDTTQLCRSNLVQVSQDSQATWSGFEAVATIGLRCSTQWQMTDSNSCVIVSSLQQETWFKASFCWGVIWMYWDGKARTVLESISNKNFTFEQLQHIAAIAWFQFSYVCNEFQSSVLWCAFYLPSGIHCPKKTFECGTKCWTAGARTRALLHQAIEDAAIGRKIQHPDSVIPMISPWYTPMIRVTKNVQELSYQSYLVMPKWASEVCRLLHNSGGDWCALGTLIHSLGVAFARGSILSWRTGVPSLCLGHQREP